MAILQNTLIGRARRSIGGVTFSTWKGLNVGKSKPVSVANPNTIKQQAQRSAVSQIVAIYRQTVAPVNIGFAKLAIHQSPYNAFTSANLKSAFNLSAPPVATLLPAMLKFAKGTIQQTTIATFVAHSGTETASGTWSDTPLGVGQSTTDNAIVVVHNRTQDKWTYSNDVTRDNLAGGVATSNGFVAATGDVIDGYFFFQSATTGEVSDSFYITTVAIV